MGSLPRVPIAAHSPASERPLDLPWERSDLRGEGGHAAPALPASLRQHCVRHTAARLTRPLARAGSQAAMAILLEHAARPALDAGALRHYIPNACMEGGATAEGQWQERHSRFHSGAQRLAEPPRAGEGG